MLKKIINICLLVALGLSAGTAPAAFQDVAVSPRARGMGEAGVAVTDGPYATYLNPGHLAELSKKELAASYVQPFGVEFMDYYHVGTAIPVAGIEGGFGLSLTQLKTDYKNVTLDKETQLSLGYGRVIFADMHSTIALGASLNMYHLDFGTTVSGLEPGNDSAFGFDVGLLATVHKRTKVGVLIKNLNNSQIGVDEEELPHRLLAGVSYEPYDGVITTFELDSELDHDVQYHGGIEMHVVENFALRGGIITNPSKLTAGFGYKLHPITLNYGFSTGGGTLDSTHQFGLSIAWGGEAP